MPEIVSVSKEVMKDLINKTVEVLYPGSQPAFTSNIFIPKMELVGISFLEIIFVIPLHCFLSS